MLGRRGKALGRWSEGPPGCRADNPLWRRVRNPPRPCLRRQVLSWQEVIWSGVLGCTVGVVAARRGRFQPHSQRSVGSRERSRSFGRDIVAVFQTIDDPAGGNPRTRSVTLGHFPGGSPPTAGRVRRGGRVRRRPSAGLIRKRSHPINRSDRVDSPPCNAHEVCEEFAFDERCSCPRA